MKSQSRRRFLQGSLAIAGLGLLWGCGRLPQPGQPSSGGAKVPRIGVLSLSRSDEHRVVVRFEAFRQGLRELGYAEGQNLAIEWRYAEGRPDLLPTLAGELAGSGVEIVVAAASPETQAARDATVTIPIVMLNSGDPVAEGFVASLARPGGNVTGLTSISRALTAKRLELLREAVPTLSRVAVVWNSANPAKSIEVGDPQAAARTLSLDLQSLEVREPGDFQGAFAAVAREGAQAMIALPDALVGDHRTQIADFAARNRLPSMYEARAFAEAGGLFAYGPSDVDRYRRAAAYVDKILRGAKPADLPVEQPTRFEFVINLKTARAFGLTIPQSVLLQATEVIQ